MRCFMRERRMEKDNKFFTYKEIYLFGNFHLLNPSTISTHIVRIPYELNFFHKLRISCIHIYVCIKVLFLLASMMWPFTY